jgi:hypothetical protein
MNRKLGKKNLVNEVKQVQQQHPDAVVELWCEDEHRMGLVPVMRRVWVDEWEQPTAQVNWKREWLWLYSFVHPNSGETYWWLLPYVNTQLFNRVLKDFARHFGVGEHKRIVLVLDQAGWHSSKELEVPHGIHKVFLPSHSPELQPAERLWPLTNESIANESFTCLDELEKLVIERCRTLLEHRDLIKGLTLFHWWSEVAA